MSPRAPRKGMHHEAGEGEQRQLEKGAAFRSGRDEAPARAVRELREDDEGILDGYFSLLNDPVNPLAATSAAGAARPAVKNPTCWAVFSFAGPVRGQHRVGIAAPTDFEFSSLATSGTSTWTMPA